MIDVRGPYHNGAAFTGLSAVLHLIAPVFSNGTPPATILVLLGLGYAALSYGLFQGWRWLAYLAFVAMMVGGLFDLAHVWGDTTGPNWLFVAAFCVNWGAVIALFVALWKPRSEAEA